MIHPNNINAGRANFLLVYMLRIVEFHIHISSQVVEKIVEPDLQGHQRAEGTASYSYRVKLMGHQRESPPVVAHQEVESPSSEGHPSPNKIIVNRPSGPASRPRATNCPGKDKDGINKIHRSTSTREYGKFDQTVQRKYSKLHKLDD